MAKIKSVKTSSGKRVQIGSKAYNARVGAGESIVSGSGKNLSGGDIRSLQKTSPDFTDEVSTTKAKRDANAEGELLPYQENAGVDTSQPSPQTTNVTPPTEQGLASYEQAQSALSAGGLSGDALTAAQSALANKYQRALPSLQAQGAAPQDGGQALSAISAAIPPEVDTTNVDNLFAGDYGDPIITGIMQQITQLNSPDERKTSLMQDYKSLYRKSGLDDINEELIDAETILDGTEDDIRNEIQTAGGFATDSQVQAMTLSRNKGLLKRYNQLFAMKQSAQQQLDTMMNLNIQDRQMAQSRIDNQINTMFKFAEFRQQSQNAYQETARWALTTMGADGLYASMKNDPKQVAAYEKMMGLPTGGLATAATQAATARANENYLQSLQIKKAEQDVGIGLPQTPEGQIPSDILNKATEGERKGFGFLQRAQDATSKLDELEEAGFDFGASRAYSERFEGIPVIGSIAKGFQPQDYKSYKQAAESWIKATLRLESGATIPPDEMSSYFETYFPTYGDSKNIRDQKAQARASAEGTLEAIAGRLAPYSTGGFNPSSFYE